MDWATTTQPVLVAFPRGSKRDGGTVGSERVLPESDAFRWSSRYGSVVTTMYGVGAADGMNERGLGGHCLYFTSCEFGDRRPGRPAVHAGLWLQLLLDLAATVDEALDVLDTVDLIMAEAHGFKASLHVAIEDASGDSAIIEHVDGERQVFHGREHTVMTNDPPYPEQLENLAEYGFEQATRETPIPGNVSPRHRFVRASFYRDALPEPADERRAIASILAIARNVSVPFGAPYKEPGTVYDTEYRTACDLTNRRYFFELTTNPSLIWVDLGHADLNAGAPVSRLDPDDIELHGDVTDQFAVVDHIPF